MRVAAATSARFPDLDADSIPLLAALADRGVDARPAVWSDPDVDWESFDAVLIRSTWDYDERLDEFLAWVASVPVPLFNPPEVVAWNAHKSYLRDLERRGVPVVDTEWIAAGESLTVTWPEAVVKPAVDASAKGLRRAARGERIAADRDLMIQPLLRSIETEGELSLLYAGRELSHAVRKTPREGDIRVQAEWGGRTIRFEPDTEARSVARKALDATDGEILYARVDLVRANDGTLRLIELELIEPSLFLVDDPEATARFATTFSAAFARLP
ncbi:MAG TPA: hypothetical protein VGW10_08130 [Solirubrobacteraceae bacterium]|nr:hypothetical protein [Solirubrobacteraceae bacterium]